MFPLIRRSPVATRFAVWLTPWALLAVLALLLSSCAVVSAAVSAAAGLSWPALAMAVTLALAACGQGSSGGNGGGTGQSTTPADCKSFPAVFSVSTLNGCNGFQILGVNPGDNLGTSISAAGDINGDGTPDFLIGAPGVDEGGYDRGAVYVVFGRSSGFSWPATFDQNTLDGTNGFVLVGGNSDLAGSSVSAAGDLNGDGHTDLLIGAPKAPAGGTRRGAVYVVFGQPSGFSWPATLNLDTLDGTNGFQIQGVNTNDRIGQTVSAAGDLNGDGHPDLLIGAPAAPAADRGAYVVFGQSSGFSWPAILSISSLNGSNGFKITGVNLTEEVGFSIAAAGDINGDGLADVLIGAPYAAGGGTDRGAVYAVFGQSSGFSWPADLSLSTLDGSNGFQIQGANDVDLAGFAVSAVGDINGDGTPDFLIANRGGGAYSYAEAHVVFGQSSGFSWPAILSLSTLDGSNGFELLGGSGGDVASVGAADLNGDGAPDLLIGEAGSYAVDVVFGQSSGFAWPAVVALSSLDGSNGFKIQGSSFSAPLGKAVSAVGDLNGDGHPDVVLGADSSSLANVDDNGAVYVVFGLQK